MRLAIVSPLPPAASGIADYTVDLVALAAPRHEIELFHAQEVVHASGLPPGLALHAAAELPQRHGERAFDLVVYQMGNGRLHDFLYDLVSRVPGLLVLHDLVLHHARAAQFLEAKEVRDWRTNPGSVEARERAQGVLDAWRAELEYSYPRAGARLFAAHLGTVGDLLPYAYPLFRIPVEASRFTAVHNRFMADAIRDELPEAPVAVVPMPASRVPVDAAGVRALRARLGFGDNDLVVGVFGMLTDEKRPRSVARAVARLAARHPELRLLLVGPVPDASRLGRELDRLELRGRTVMTGRVAIEELPRYVEAADVVAHLRYPTARETSAALLRVLAQGRPSIVSDLEQQADLPGDAVLRVDVAEEDAGLERALARLARDPELRASLGRAAAEYVAREHGPERVKAAWADVFERARRSPQPAPRDWPSAWPRPSL